MWVVIPLQDAYPSASVSNSVESAYQTIYLQDVYDFFITGLFTLFVDGAHFPFSKFLSVSTNISRDEEILNFVA